MIIQSVKHADKEYTKTSYIGLNIGWEVLSCSEAIAWRSLSEHTHQPMIKIVPGIVWRLTHSLSSVETAKLVSNTGSDT